ncbi:MAG: hypothetical protein NC110_05960 [Ruminococcus sp.]|nr:hypothetical protein [Ruminococcus sp.]
MRKIIRRVFLCFFAVIFAGIAALAVYITHDPDRPTVSSVPKVTDAAGNTYLAVTEKGSKETYAAVTDANGNVYAAKIDDKGNIGETVASLDGSYSPSDLPSNYTGPQINESVNPNDFTGNVDVIASGAAAPEAPQQSTSQAQTPTNGSQNNQTPTKNQSQTEPTYKYRIQKYQQIFSGGTYLMEFTTDDKELGDQPITAAVKNGNLIIDAQIEGMQCKMLYLAEKDTMYIVLDKFRKYCKLPKELMGDDMNMSELNMMANFADETKDKEISVSTVTLNGQKLTCESYVTDDGTTMRYYFSGDTLVRLDSVEKNGQITSTFFSKITSDVPDSTFEIPDNYGFFNLAWLSALGGLGEE